MAIKPKKRWTLQEVQLLKQHSSKGIDYMLKILPNRSEQAIRVKCCYMKLDLDNVEKIYERLYMVV